jgi:hypothetical protein
MSAIPHVTRGELPPNADAAVRLLYSRHAEALHAYVVRFCPDRALQALRQHLQDHDATAA